MNHNEHKKLRKYELGKCMKFCQGSRMNEWGIKRYKFDGVCEEETERGNR